MKPVIYSEKDLPIQALEELNLAANGQALLNAADLRALLSGGRTGMLNFRDLENGDLKIASMDGKLSLQPGDDGKLQLLIHPIYNKAQAPDFLNQREASQLEKGEVANVLKIVPGKDGNKKELLIEYDAETREFIVSDTELIIAPDKVNNEKLGEAQRSRYRKGSEVEIADGTQFQYAASKPEGMVSNKTALVASILLDGGLSFVVMKALTPFFDKKEHAENADKLSPGYYTALKDAEHQKPAFTRHYDDYVQRPKR